MEGAGVNYLHPIAEPGEFWDGGNTQTTARLERKRLPFTSAHQNPLPALKSVPGVVKQQKKFREKLWRTP